MATALTKLGIIDFRAELARASWSRPARRATRYATVHYNGPAVKAFGYPRGELDQLWFDARYHMRADVLGADGLQYHAAITSDGNIYQCRDWSLSLWHCGNTIGNAESVSIHLPLGGNQIATERQRASLRRLLEALRADYGFDRANVRNHSEWKNTQCPGNYLRQWVSDYRTEKQAAPLEWFETVVNANCRSAPAMSGDVKVIEVTPAGTVFGVDAIIEDGEAYRGERAYVHRADGIGFYHLSVVRPYQKG